MDVAREVHEVFVFIVKTNVPDLVQLPSDGEPDGGEPKAGELGCPVVEHMFAEVRVGDIRHGTMNSGEFEPVRESLDISSRRSLFTVSSYLCALGRKPVYLKFISFEQLVELVCQIKCVPGIFWKCRSAIFRAWVTH